VAYLVGQVDAAARQRSLAHRQYELELTGRELDVLRLIAAGGTSKDVAAALGIRAKTVMHHSVAIYRKLGVPWPRRGHRLRLPQRPSRRCPAHVGSVGP
jgi:DNA-binding NarL/FixJ family response regulator